MIKTFTQDDVVRFIYNETSAVETEELQQAIICDAELNDFYVDMLLMKKELDNSMKTPSDKVVSNLINYSKSLNLHSNH